MAEPNTFYRFPDTEASDEYIRQYHNRHFARYSAYRNRHMQRIATSLYYIIGRQWIEDDREAMLEGMRGFTFRDQKPDDQVELPRPVTNMIAPAIDVEFATLSKRQWMPKIPTYSRDPRTAAANKVAQDVLKDRLKKLHWEDLRDRFILNLCSMGTAIFWSYWNETFFERTWRAVPTPFTCTLCGANYASNTISPAAVGLLSNGNIPQISDMEIDGDEELQSCPQCGGNLGPTFLTEEESHQTDPFGRPLGGDVPVGNTALELITPFEYYPQNAGLNHTPEDVRTHGICKVRSLDWIEEHHPDIIDEVQPEDPTDLMRDHPLMGAWDFVGRFSRTLDSGIYDHHARVYDLYSEPSYRYPNGRHIRLIGWTQKLIAINGDYLRSVQDDSGKRIQVPVGVVASAIWKPRDGEFWGKCLADDILSPQNRLNAIDAQVIEARERMGSPNLLVPSDANLDGPAYRSSYGVGKIFYWDPSPVNPAARPEPFGSILMPSGVYNERTACEQSITKIIGPADIEIGEAPRNITTTSGLQILGEQAERRRATRERGITSAIQKVWEHQLQMLWTLRVDVDSYEAELPDGSWEVREFKGQMIEGQTKVEIEKEAYIDRSIVVRESVREAMIDGLYDATTPIARKRLLELRGLPTDVNEDSNLQIEHARRQWVDFVDKGIIPVIDPALDNAYIRSQVIGQFLMEDEGKNLSDAALWPQLLPILAGWESEFDRLSAADTAARQQYGGEPAPQQGAEMYAQAMIAWQEADTAYKANPMAAQVSPPPQKPVPPIFLPQQPEQRVYVVWQGILNRKLLPEMDPNDPQQKPQQGQALMQLAAQAASQTFQDPQELVQQIDHFLRFRAVYEAYRLAAPPAPPPGSELPARQSPTPSGVGPGEKPQGPPPTPGTPPQPPTPVGA